MSNDISILNGTETVDKIQNEVNPMLSMALAYASKGWNVFPLLSKEKTPLTSHGCKDGTTDTAIIRQWWGDTPNANIGIATGAESGLLVLDVDMGVDKNGVPKVGKQSLAEINSQYGDLPPTLVQRTGGGGNQHLFNYPDDDIKYGNKTNLAGFKHIDIRGEGGYVVAPPSIHPTGGTYTWSNDLPIANAPQWLLKLITGEIAPNAHETEMDAFNATGDPLGSIPQAEVNTLPTPPIEIPHDSPRHRKHLKKRAKAYLATAEPAIEGQRGDTHTFSVAGNLLALDCNGERLSVREVIEAMAEWNRRCSPPWDITGLTAKVASASTNGTPRAVKECQVCGGDAVGENWGIEATPISDQKPEIEKSYSPTNIGNGQLFSDTYRNELMYVSEWKRWLKWNGKRWEHISPEIIRRQAHRLVVEIMPIIAKRITSDDERAKYYKHISASHQTYQIDAMLKEATAYMAVAVGMLDANPMLCNLQNGTLDCKTGELRPHCRDDFITKISPCRYDPTATAPIWGKFLERIMTDADSLQFLQTAMGYSLTGSVAEECVIILWGNGANGKSTFLETLLYCLGDYGQAMSPSVLLAENRDGVNSDEIARLFGVRCAVAVETKKGGAFNCEKVKALTGGDRISACRKYEHPFEFDPTHKIWLATNFQPPIKDNDDGMWRRIRLVEFSANITDAEKDTGLKGRGGKLAMEADGIMAWMIEGLKRWHTNGLPTPKRVKDATEAYRADSDYFGQFLTDNFIIDARATVKSLDLFKEYIRWAEDNGMTHPMTNMSMSKCLQERGFIKLPRRSDGVFWQGLGFIQDTTPNATEDNRAF